MDNTNSDKAKYSQNDINYLVKEMLREIKGMPSEDVEDHDKQYQKYHKFFNKHLPNAKKDFITGTVFERTDKGWFPVENKVRLLKSYAMSEDLNKTCVEDHLQRWLNMKKPEMLVDVPEWDGVDRVGKIGEWLKVSNVSQECVSDLFKEWGAKMFARINCPKVQNKLIVLKGNQGVGKDTFVEALLGHWDFYFNNFIPSHQEKDNYLNIGQSILVNISEFDRTAKFAVSSIKDMITRESATYRSPYDKKPVKHSLHCSFISTCNIDDFLRDTTGNRRFVVFDVDSIDWSYPKKQSAQFLAQWKVLNNERFTASKSSLDEMNKYIIDQTPDDIILAALESYDDKIGNIRSNTIHKGLGIEFSDIARVRYAEVESIVSAVCKLHSIRPQTFLQALKRTGRSKNVGGTVYFFVSAQI